MSYSKSKERIARRAVLTGDKQVTEILDASNTEQIVQLSNVASKVTVQSLDSLAGNVLFSSNGVDFYSSTAFSANTPVSFSAHNVVAVKVSRTSGSGKLVILAV